MKATVSFVCILALVTVGADAGKMQVTPIQKVLKLLQGMLEKGKKEKHEEEVMFSEARQFCDDNQHVKKISIEEEVQNIDKLEALMKKDDASIEHYKKIIALLQTDTSTWEGDLDASKKVRDIEKADYQKTHDDYDESIEAVGKAIAVLKKQTEDKKQASEEGLFAQVSASVHIPENAKQTIMAFVQQSSRSDSDAEGAPEANAYEFQSHGVVDMLTKLQDKFTEERTNLEKEEANSKHAYDLMQQELKAEIKQAAQDEIDKSKAKSKTMQSLADETADDKSEISLKEDDTKSLSDLVADCNMKAEDFEARQKLRAGEIEAIEKAIEIISSGAVSGAGEKHLPQLVQEDATSFGQLRSTTSTQTRQSLAMFLRAQAKKSNSRVLEVVAQRVTEDPFAKVKKMLKDLVVRLMEEANEEAEHKGFCDTELGTNEQTRKEKTEAVETLHSEIDQHTASIAKLTEKITNLNTALTELDKAMGEATEIRNTEKAKAKETVEDAQAAQVAVAQALTVLRDFYAKAAEATSFAQDTDIMAEPYKGMQEENGGVIGMLEVIESDFARLESETAAGESSAQKEYDEFMNDSKEDKAAKSTALEHKEAKKQDKEQSLTALKEDLEGTQKELDSALAYFDKLKPSCVDSGESYEDRVARRKDEIESMQEALKVLNGEDLA